jgi:hypothetical protein
MLFATAAVVPLGCTGPASEDAGPGPAVAPSGGAALDATDPCRLLGETELAGLNLQAGRARTSDGNRLCTFPGTDKSFAVAVTVYADEGLDEIVPDTILQGPMRVGRHDAIQHHDGNLVCVVSRAVGGSASVDVGTAAAKQAKDATPDDLTRSCQVSERAARLVESRLP